MGKNKNSSFIALLLLAFVAAGLPAATLSAQAYQQLSQATLDKLVAPVALYPDPLLAQVLQASAYPDQVEKASQWVATSGDAGRMEGHGLEPSIMAVAHYPSVLRMMDEQLAWTTQLGQAYRNQEKAVFQAVQRMRGQAHAKGNLISTPQQQVVLDNNQISIVPASSDVLYVPSYNPAVVYSETAPAYAPLLTFGTGLAMGSWMASDVEWNSYTVAPRPYGWGAYYYGPGGPGYGAAWYHGPYGETETAAAAGRTWSGGSYAARGQTTQFAGGGEAGSYSALHTTPGGGVAEDRGWAAEKGDAAAGGFSRSGTTGAGGSYDVQGAGARGRYGGVGGVSASGTTAGGESYSRSWTGTRTSEGINTYSSSRPEGMFAGHESGSTAGAFSQRGYTSRFGGGAGGFHGARVGGFHGGRR